MRHTLRSAIAAILFLTFGALPAAADFAHQDYKPASLKAAFAVGEAECTRTEMNPAALNEYALVKDKTAFRVPAVWTGEKRPISKAVQDILAYYEGVRGRPFEQIPVAEVFTTEVHVTEAGRDYWLPIQKHILEMFEAEVGPVKNVELYVMYFGCSMKPPIAVAVVINEFQAKQ